MPRKRLLLIGGGHAHLFVLEALRLQEQRAQLDVTLVSRDLHTPYSGMLPGLVAGHYRSGECHIDLQPLAAAAGVRLVRAEVTGLDLAHNRAITDNDELPFDIVSIDIGSSPSLSAVPGASVHALSVKPIDMFLPRWQAVVQSLDSASDASNIVVVGGGAGGSELVLAMAHRLAALRGRVKLSLITRDKLLPGYPRHAAHLMASRLAQADIGLCTATELIGVDDRRLYFSNRTDAAYDMLILATGAAPQSWIAASGLECVDGGFIAVDQSLQSVSHPHVFAAGDIATDPQYRRPKAGVFAVRQGPVLAENLMRYAREEDLLAYRPQRDYLSLLSTGNRHAIAVWYGLVWQGSWVWRWKDAIDRKFMQRFTAPFRH